MAATADDDEQYLANLVERLLKLGAPPDPATRYGVTPLMLATERDRGRIATVLLEAGASPTAKMQSGESALSIARQKGYHSIALLLEGAAKQDGGQR